jgi:2-C-methyl-D-erythritol 4-phosphate cytidylyltransferase
MDYGIILAGGSGVRMKNSSLPKQFLLMHGKPIIVYSIERFIGIQQFDYIYIAINKNHKDKLMDLMREYNLRDDRIIIIAGGDTRFESLLNCVNDIKKNAITEDDVITIHDAARPFVSGELIVNCMNSARKNGGAIAALKSYDSLVFSSTGEFFESTIDRDAAYSLQTPEACKLKLFLTALDQQNAWYAIHTAHTTHTMNNKVTTTVEVLVNNKIKVALVPGDERNIKITTAQTFELAEKGYC